MLAELLKAGEHLRLAVRVFTCQQVSPHRQSAVGQTFKCCLVIRRRDVAFQHGVSGVQSNADSYCVTMPQREVGHQFEPVRGPVAEIQRAGAAHLKGVARGGDVVQVQGGGFVDGPLHQFLVARSQAAGVFAKPLEERFIFDDSDLERFSQSADPFALRQGLEEIKIVYDRVRGAEGAREVLHTAVVHAVLDTHPGIILRQHGGWQSREAQAAVDERGGETCHVQNAAAAGRDDVAVAVKVRRACGSHDLAHAVPTVLGVLAARHDHGVAD